MSFDIGTAYGLSWRLAPHLPEWFVRLLGDVGARITYKRGGARQLRKSLARLRPGASLAELDELALAGMKEYARYWAEMFMLPKFADPEKLADRVRVIGALPDPDELHTSIALALGHTGNWDTAGAWLTLHTKTLTVAEKLEPESVFRSFLKFRKEIGIEIIPLERGTNVFGRLVKRAKEDKLIVALLADRDLTRSGVEVQLSGEPAFFAAGPAAIALALDIPLYFVGIRSDKIVGRDGRKRWGIELDFRLVERPTQPSDDRVKDLTQAWVDLFGEWITAYPASWHMLQPVFVADLDPERLARRGH